MARPNYPPTYGFERSLDVRIATTAVGALRRDPQYNLVSWALNSFGVPLDDFLPGSGS